MPGSIESDVMSHSYVGDLTFEKYLSEVRANYPWLAALFDPERIALDAVTTYIGAMDQTSWEFEDQNAGGRGAAYVLSQHAHDNRRIGMETLLKCFSHFYDELPGPDFTILDVLGGGGTIAQFLSSLSGPVPRIITADLSKFMIGACRQHAFPYIRQSATRSLLRDNVLDGVLIAYGSQLLAEDARQPAIREAHRTLKPGHRLVLHAFEIGTRIAGFFDNVVHPYSRTAHAHTHFTRTGVLDLFSQAGFRDVRLFDMSDPFTIKGRSAVEARTNALMFVHRMYDLIKIASDERNIGDALEPLIESTLGPISVSSSGDHFVARIPRSVLVAVGTKSQ